MTEEEEREIFEAREYLQASGYPTADLTDDVLRRTFRAICCARQWERERIAQENARRYAESLRSR